MRSSGASSAMRPWRELIVRSPSVTMCDWLASACVMTAIR
jgi:hypothetical protein